MPNIQLNRGVQFTIKALGMLSSDLFVCTFYFSPEEAFNTALNWSIACCASILAHWNGHS